MELRIASTWDGQPLGHEEVPVLTIRRQSGALIVCVDAPFYDDPRPAQEPGSVDGLWEYEVVEWFVVGEGEPVPYLEVEMGPHGHHLVLQLEGIRNPVRTYQALEYTTQIVGKRWMGEARIPVGWLPSKPVRHNGFAIHGVGKQRVYAAAYPVPGPQPDFHRLTHFGYFTGLDGPVKS